MPSPAMHVPGFNYPSSKKSNRSSNSATISMMVYICLLAAVDWQARAAPCWLLAMFLAQQAADPWCQK
eukprot:2161875-Alexandrium_andersonii.AAC.1